MKFIYAILLFISTQTTAQQKSTQSFDNIALTNNIVFTNEKYNLTQTATAFLLKYQSDTFAVTAKNIIWRHTPPEMKSLSFEPYLKSWEMNVPGKTDQSIITHQLINANPAELLSEELNRNNDFLVFSITENHSHAKPVEPRLTPLNFGEKLFVVGGTTGAQQVYEFQYRKITGKLVTITDQPIPASYAALAGAPVLDEQGMLVGIISINPNTTPGAGISFAMCTVDSLLDIVKADKKE